MSLLMNFFTLIATVISLPLQLIEAVGLYGVYKRIFPFCLYRLSLSYNQKMHDKKKALFSGIAELKKPGRTLSLLEIGCGTGTNFEFYPSECKITCVDPNPHFEKFLQKSMADSEQHLTFERFVVASGEDMGVVEDESVDVVVCTLVLCSVSDVRQTLREVHRILKPGGAFFFLEHVVADPSTWTYFFQHVLQPLWYYFGDGCYLTRSTWKDLEAAGFSELKLTHTEGPLIFLIRPHIVGHAVK
ncbi:methyltransferase-like protein 7A [Myripristis murdjan]|uniref:Thiol methyltransferase 1A n=1 Tax=Myripristis murdjan TaxID=586833 RepID=A0A668AE42_9TELE|nr:methyltransferase-like protein 7A [Myripristis murdjan]